MNVLISRASVFFVILAAWGWVGTDWSGSQTCDDTGNVKCGAFCLPSKGWCGTEGGGWEWVEAVVYHNVCTTKDEKFPAKTPKEVGWVHRANCSSNCPNDHGIVNTSGTPAGMIISSGSKADVSTQCQDTKGAVKMSRRGLRIYNER